MIKAPILKSLVILLCGYPTCFAFAETPQLAMPTIVPKSAQDNQQQEEGKEQVLDEGIVHPNPEDDWLLPIHETISDSVFGTALWFDSFFATDEIQETAPQTLARIRLGFEPRARDLDVFSHRFRLKLTLPNLENRVDLLLSDEDFIDGDAQQTGAVQPLDRDQQEDRFTAALRLVNIDSLDKFVDTRVGISSGDLFLKARARVRIPFNERQQVTFQPELYYFIDDGLGASWQMGYEYNHSDSQQWRANLRMHVSEAFSGYRWRNSYYYLQQHNRFQATALGVALHGKDNDEEGFVVDNYALTYLYRVNAYRRWLYFEVEPFLHFPKEHDYKITPGVAFRVEGYFQSDG